METITLTPAVQSKSGELAASASAALAKATIEAKFAVALHRPRNVDQARLRLLDHCKRRGFAEGAKYKLPRGKNPDGSVKHVYGLSIRFAEAAIQCWGNIDVSANIVFEDADKRMIRVIVTDLETNISFTDDQVLDKTVERTKVFEDQEVVGTRQNSEGKKVFIVAATEAELLQKANNAKSKAIRTSGLRLIPQDILDEAWDTCDTAIEKGGSDPALDKKRVCDAFHSIGVSVSDLEEYLQGPISGASPATISELRKVYSAIRDGETTWVAVVKASQPIDVDTTKVPTKKAAPAPKKDDTVPMDGPTPMAKKEAAKAATKPQVTAQEELCEKVNMIENVSWEGFRDWLIQTAQLDENVICDGFEMLPTALCDSLLAKPKILEPALKMIKAKEGK